MNSKIILHIRDSQTQVRALKVCSVVTRGLYTEIAFPLMSEMRVWYGFLSVSSSTLQAVKSPFSATFEAFYGNFTSGHRIVFICPGNVHFTLVLSRKWLKQILVLFGP